VEVQVKASQAGGGGTAYVDSLSLVYATSTMQTPSNIVLISKTDKTVDLSWDTVTQAVYYDIYRGTTRVGTTAATSYTVAGLAPNTSYDITVRAKDAEGFVSLPSEPLQVTTESAGSNLLTNGGFDTVKGDAGWTLW